MNHRKAWHSDSIFVPSLPRVFAQRSCHTAVENHCALEEMGFNYRGYGGSEVWEGKENKNKLLTKIPVGEVVVGTKRYLRREMGRPTSSGGEGSGPLGEAAGVITGHPRGSEEDTRGVVSEEKRTNTCSQAGRSRTCSLLCPLALCDPRQVWFSARMADMGEFVAAQNTVRAGRVGAERPASLVFKPCLKGLWGSQRGF